MQKGLAQLGKSIKSNYLLKIVEGRFILDTEWFKFFMTIAEGSTFLDAAQTNNISQSSLSKAIRRLESELNVELFDRSGRSAKLTPAGKCLYDDLQQLAPGFSKMMANIRKYSRIITCWALPSVTVLRFQYMINEFLKLHPHIAIDLVGNNNPFNLFKAFEEGRVDLALVHQSIADSKYYNTTFLRDDYLLAVLPTTHPLANSNSICFSDLHNENIILNRWKIEALKEYFSTLDFSPKITITSVGRESVLADVASGYGIALYYLSDINIFKLNDFAVCRIIDIPNNPLVLATPKDLKLTENHNQLIHFLVNKLAKDD
jgi:DNA-binding transcriptional LysR family regulator